ncbi:MAG TPA: hypothetical protein VGK25_07325 [Ignavibacteria bacterium]|jgi:dihydroorotate dehydrogenase
MFALIVNKIVVFSYLKLINSLFKFVKKQSGDKLVVIACGGISSVDDVKEKLDMGASLVQLYTGLIYEGPGLVKN